MQTTLSTSNPSSIPDPSRPTPVWIAEIRAKAATRNKLASELAAAGLSVRLYNKDGRSVLVGPDLEKPGISRLTYFDQHGPSGHMEYNSLRAAISDGLLHSFFPKAA